MLTMTTGEIHEACVALAAIMNRPRNIPHTAKFKLALIHKVLYPIAEKAEQERYKLVHELGEEVKDEQGNSRGWQLKESNKALYEDGWKKVAEVAHVVKISPITLHTFGEASEGGIEANEFRMLGQLVTE